MKFLVDVNLTKTKEFLDKHENFINVIDIIGGEALDEEIIKYAKEHGYGIYTQDTKCALQGLIEGIIVWYRDQETGQSFKLKAEQQPFTKEELKEGL